MTQYELIDQISVLPIDYAMDLGVQANADATQSGVVFYIIGDRFTQFCDHNVVLNYSEALEQHAIISRLAKHIVLGQGIGATQLVTLQKALNSPAKRRAIIIKQRLSDRVPAALVDKLDEQNVLITRPTIVSPLNYSCHLVVDAQCRDLADCENSEHLPGGLLIEAAKQLFIASIRTHTPAPLDQVPQDDLRYLLNGMQVQFDHFVFPIAAELHLSLHDIKSDGLRTKDAATVTITQLGRQCCQITFYAHAYNQAVSASLEKRCGIRIKNRLIAAEQ